MNFNFEEKKELELKEWQLLHSKIRLLILKRIEISDRKDFWQKQLADFEEQVKSIETKILEI